MPQAHFATIYAKPAGWPLVDTFMTEGRPGYVDPVSLGFSNSIRTAHCRAQITGLNSMFTFFCKKVFGLMQNQLVIFLAVVVTTGCANMEISRNVDELKRVETGQLREDVFKAMGPAAIEKEISGRRFAVFYQTSAADSPEAAVTTDLCTPILFEDGRVTGVGGDLYEQWLREEKERQRQVEIKEARRLKAEMAEAERKRNFLERKEKIAVLEKEVGPVPASNPSLNLKLYRQLLALDSKNVRYQKKVAYYEDRLARQQETQKLRTEKRAREKYLKSWEQSRDVRNKKLRQYTGNGIAEIAIYDMGKGSLYVWVKNVSYQIITTHPDYFTLIDNDNNPIPCVIGDSLNSVLEPGSLSHGKIEYNSVIIPRELVFQNRESGRVSKSFK